MLKLMVIKSHPYSMTLFGGRNLFYSLPRGRMDASEKWMIIWVTSHQPNHYSPKMDVLTKTFLQIILAAK